MNGDVMPAHSYADDPVTPRSRSLDDAIATSQFIDRLPRTMTTLPQFALASGDADQPWEVTVTLVPSDQAALDALHPTAMQLCAAAQHALGLAGIGSIIEPARGTVLVRAPEQPQLWLIGASALWWVANAPPPLLQAFLEHVAAEVEQRRRG
jgi:hypothetical protein